VPKDDIENKLEEWAMRWLERFKPFSSFFRSLNIIGYEIEAYYDKLFGDVIMEALLTNRALNCQLIAKFSEYGYAYCNGLYVQTKSHTEKFIGDETQFKEFSRNSRRMLKVNYWYPSIIHITVYEGELIRAEELGRILGDVFIILVDVWPNSFYIRFKSPSNENIRGDLTFLISSSGGLLIYWSGVVGREDVRNKAMQDVFKHISELDKALESLYSILSVGLKGVVSYILY
jgi:hypothetical protein